MLSRSLTAALLLAGLSLGGGCRMYPCDCGGYDYCIGKPYGTACSCGGGCDSCGVDACGCDGGCGCDTCDMGCDSCGYDACGCDTCGGCGGCGLLDRLHGLFDCCSCAGGCGEKYYGSWLSDPPDCCDPCDCWGGWCGHQGCCRKGKGFFGGNFWGYRYDGGCESGCHSTCACCVDHGFHDAHYGETYVEGDYYEEGDVYYEESPSQTEPRPAERSGPPTPPADTTSAHRPGRLQAIPTHSAIRRPR